jgi:aspartyl/asparaginyl beta-hydroxylase (cupin superfamily)
MKQRLCLRNLHRFNINYVVYGNIYNRVTKWLYVIDEELTDGLKKIRVVLRKLKREDHHVFGTFSIRFQFFFVGKAGFTDIHWCEIFIGTDVVLIFVTI